MRPIPDLDAARRFAPSEERTGAVLAALLWSASAAQLAAMLIWISAPAG